jgi:hypothetical protein
MPKRPSRTLLLTSQPVSTSTLGEHSGGQAGKDR